MSGCGAVEMTTSRRCGPSPKWGHENIAVTVMATRGARLVLTRICGSDLAIGAGEFSAEVLNVIEIDAENWISVRVGFDVDDIDAAVAELDARYVAGEAADHAQTWSVIAEAYAAFNLHELPAADVVTIDRRRATPFESTTMTETLRAIWDLTPDLSIRIEAVHRLSSFGAVVSHVRHGTSPEGFDAEWRMIQLLTVDGDRISRNEIFDEADLDAALARFDELQPRAPRLENAASQAYERFQAHFATRDWDAIADMLTADLYSDDRRAVVGGGIRPGRDALIEDLRAVADVEITSATSM